MDKLKGISLFSGSGGMDIGVRGGFSYLGKKYAKNPIDILYSIDNDEHACDLYNHNFSHKSICADIKDINAEDIPPHHIVFGGFPCQSFSIVAQNPPRLGYKDEKGRLVFEMMRVMERKRPIAFIAENVKGILSANKGKAFPLILKGFEELGYSVTYSILNASDYGVPQKRERVFIVGFLDNEIMNNFSFPKKTTENIKVPLSAVVMAEEEVEEKYYFSERAVQGLIRSRQERGDLDKGRVQNLSQPSNTVSSHLAKVSLSSFDPVLKINGRYRMYTPREVARIQSFPEEYELIGSKTRLYRALGNAVPPVLMWHLTREVINAIKVTDKNIIGSKPFRTAKEIRSYNMSRIKSKDTSIEKILRSALWNKGYRYLVSPKNIFGKPDIVFKSRKIAIFCDSSFWHGRNFAEDIARIKTNQKYWHDKISRNIERDKEVNEKLKKDGWKVLRFWDDDIKEDLEMVVKRIEMVLSAY